MKRSRVSILIFALILGTMMGVVPKSVSAESLYIKKVVAIVYDDSSSMETPDKWPNANYATQAFCSMLNEEDDVFISYMSHSQIMPDYKPEKIDVSSAKIQKSIDSIREHTDSGSTPFGAVEIAHKKLRRSKETNPNTEFWLVIITDGAFDEFGSERDLEKNIKKLAKDKMPNGTDLNIMYFSIGSLAYQLDDNEKAGISAYSASEGDEILKVMSKMADKVSGRTRLAENDIVIIDSKTIKVASKIPLLNIAALSQDTDAKLEKVTFGGERDIPITRKANISFPGYDKLKGSSYIVGDSQKPIGAGEYILYFDKDISLNNLDILFEPALETRMEIMVNGQAIKDYTELDKIVPGDKVSVSAKLYEMGTDNEISSDILPPDTKYALTIEEDGKVVAQGQNNTMEITDYVVGKGETKLIASVRIKGFNPIEDYEEFTPLEGGESSFEQPDVNPNVPGYEIIGTPNGGPIVITEFYGNTIGASFVINKEGVKLTKSEVGDVTDVRLNEGYEEYRTLVDVKEDGTIEVIPTVDLAHVVNFKTWWFNWLYYFKLSKDNVVVTISHQYGSGTCEIPVATPALKYRILNVWLPLLLEILLLAAIIAYVIRYITKPRFAKNAMFYYGSITYYEGNEAHTLKKGFKGKKLADFNKFKYLWNPFKPLIGDVAGVDIVALSGGRIDCKISRPWYSGAFEPVSEEYEIKSPKDASVRASKESIEIIEIKPENVIRDQNSKLKPNKKTYYIYGAKVITTEGDEERIRSGKVFCYATE